MPANPKAGSVRSKYAFIKAPRKEFPTDVMCRVLGVAPSGYYERLQRPQSSRAIEDVPLLRLIRASFTASQGVYGAPRRFLDLREAGETCSKHRVERLMRENGLRALHGYRTRRWVIGKPAVLIPNLLMCQFTVTRSNAAWAIDSTYIRTWQGWLYLAVVLDLFSRKVVGWATAPTIHRELVLDAVAAALRQRRPRGTLIHSDQGVQYGSDAWRRFCRANHLEPSMSRKGNCWDNAVAESFFGSLKKERIKKHLYSSRELALSDIATYIEDFYNRSRRHSHLGGISQNSSRPLTSPGGALSTKVWELQTSVSVKNTVRWCLRNPEQLSRGFFARGSRFYPPALAWQRNMCSRVRMLCTGIAHSLHSVGGR